MGVAFRTLHAPVLLVATCLTFGGRIPFWNPHVAILEFGLPERIATSEPTHASFVISRARVSALEMAIWVFNLQGKLAAVDTILGTAPLCRRRRCLRLLARRCAYERNLQSGFWHCYRRLGNAGLDCTADLMLLKGPWEGRIATGGVFSSVNKLIAAAFPGFLAFQLDVRHHNLQYHRTFFKTPFAVDERPCPHNIPADTLAY
ncbi:uncharacterized protein Z519_10496 [Cladophialophora bantiana CBS 173.52]|uniref:Uncharacterized protein n=1 Tax=Cladophialophora bantiana (strain ATCC 10958 / CBS 173.52 / CDC B-1940 / NIH 8579) TaxID=1442370 RepID=A0A0D2EG67_CLAB1|nr:uncharacterized protein Z519_10496 [Cladophialophora bantiana CBS 173.52]KIW89011.1 hypothetical protein Z519_10496 [Cladophialophora bantiana CBS 173.52]